MKRTQNAFTLVELLIVIGIIAVLIAILLPVLTKARESAKQVYCLSNERQIGMALIMYAGENKGIMPGAQYTTGSSWGQYTNILHIGSGNTIGAWQPIGFGLVMSTGFKTNLRALYCPGRDAADKFSFEANSVPSANNLANNPAWDVWNPGLKYINGTNGILWMGYYVANADYFPNASPAVRFASWHRLGKAASDTPLVLDMYGADTIGAGPNFPAVGPSGWLKSRHMKGYNVTLFDGSGQFLPDPDNTLDGHTCNLSVQTNARPFSDFSGRPKTTGGLKTDLSGLSVQWHAPERWAHDSTAYANGVAWIEYYWLNWPDSKIKENTP